MKSPAPFFAAITAVAVFAGCSTGGSGPRFSDLFDESAAAEGTGIQFSGVVRAVVILATHDATARQRQVAQQNGRRAAARLHARHASEETAPPQRRKPRPKKSVPVASAPGLKREADPAPEREPGPAPRPKPQKKLPRYIAVDTERDANTSPKARKAVMIWDTQSETLVVNSVYDVQSPPPVGSAARFETYSAEYVGSGG